MSYSACSPSRMASPHRSCRISMWPTKRVTGSALVLPAGPALVCAVDRRASLAPRTLQPVRLDSSAAKMLGDARIGMLAIHGERLPLVNPAAFHYSAGSIWLTTSRHAVKLALARRDPRAAFMVDAGGWGLLLCCL